MVIRISMKENKEKRKRKQRREERREKKGIEQNRKK